MSADLHKDELIARYLLGDLTEKQQIEIEDRAFREQEYRQNITAVENDLIDEYVRRELPETQRRQFEHLFLTSADRRRRIDFARALSTVGGSSGSTTTTVPPDGKSASARGSRRASTPTPRARSTSDQAATPVLAVASDDPDGPPGSRPRWRAR